MHFDARPFRKRIHNRHTDTMETAGNLVSAAAKLSSRVEYRENRLERRLFGLRMSIDRYAATFIRNLNHFTRKKPDPDMRTEARHRLIDRVVDHFPYEMMQSLDRSTANIHTGALPHRVKSFQHLNGLRAIFILVFGFG